MTNIKLSALPWALLLAQAFNPAWAGPPNPTASDANGNTAGGTDALLNTGGSNNTGFGYIALRLNTGTNNTAIGSFTLANNGSIENTAIGQGALNANTFGRDNTASGIGALQTNTTGSHNTANGELALFWNTTGNHNTASGREVLFLNTTGNNNTASGNIALHSNTIGNSNTAIGDRALVNMAVGDNNLALGLNAGSSLTGGNNNIYLRNVGVAAESNTIRIGRPDHTRTFLAGVRGRSTGAANAVAVVIDSNGQLGTVNSSARFKKDIRDMSETSRKLLELRPVTYHYKQASENGSNPLEYGLIAEEVAKVYPDLVAYGADGQIETVQYHKLTPMLLNEVKRLNASVQSDKDKILAQSKEIASLKQQAQEVSQLKQKVTALQTQAKTMEALTSRLSRIEAKDALGMADKATAKTGRYPG